MLNLRRRANQVICIGPNIKVKICEINGRQVLVGIEAPPDMPVWREEIGPRPSPEGAELRAA